MTEFRGLTALPRPFLPSPPIPPLCWNRFLISLNAKQQPFMSSYISPSDYSSQGHQSTIIAMKTLSFSFIWTKSGMSSE